MLTSISHCSSRWWLPLHLNLRRMPDRPCNLISNWRGMIIMHKWRRQIGTNYAKREAIDNLHFSFAFQNYKTHQVLVNCEEGKGGPMAYNRNIPRKGCTNKVQKCLPTWYVMQTLHANLPCGVYKSTLWGWQNKDTNKCAHNVLYIANCPFLLSPLLTAEGWRPFAKQRHKIPWKIILTWPLQHGHCILWAHPWPNPPLPR